MIASPSPPAPPPQRMAPASGRSVRGMELAITCAVHALAAVAAAMAFGWQGFDEEGRRALPPPSLLILPPSNQPPAPPHAASTPDRPRPALLAHPPAVLPPHDASAAKQLFPQVPAPAIPRGGSLAPAQDAQSYRLAIMARLEAQRFYPDAALRLDWQGSGAVLFRIERNGRLLEAALATSTGHAALDRAALGMVQRAAPFPAIPENLPDELAITMPVAFLIDHPRQAETLP